MIERMTFDSSGWHEHERSQEWVVWGNAGDILSLAVHLPACFTLQNKTTGEIKTTTDPGRALITGSWKDVGKVKGPILRGLAARAPYFHNGSAASLSDVLDFYERRFHVGFTA